MLYIVAFDCQIYTCALSQVLQNRFHTPSTGVGHFLFLQEIRFHVCAPPSLCLQILRRLCRLCCCFDSAGKPVVETAHKSGERIDERARRGTCTGVCEETFESMVESA